MFLEQQISILEWFLKDHVTLKTGVMSNILILLLLFDQLNAVLETSFKINKCIYKQTITIYKQKSKMI